MSKSRRKAKPEELNEDPLTGASGSHPVGVALGATGGAAAGAAVGAVGGPVGVAVGAAVGGVAGGLAGKGAAETVNPTAEDAYWREHYRDRPYVREGHEYEYYQPAYRFGWESFSQFGHRSFDELDEGFARDWDERRGALACRPGATRGRRRAMRGTASRSRRRASPTFPRYAGRRHS